MNTFRETNGFDVSNLIGVVAMLKLGWLSYCSSKGGGAEVLTWNAVG